MLIYIYNFSLTLHIQLNKRYCPLPIMKSVKAKESEEGPVGLFLSRNNPIWSRGGSAILRSHGINSMPNSSRTSDDILFMCSKSVMPICGRCEQSIRISLRPSMKLSEKHSLY